MHLYNNTFTIISQLTVFIISMMDIVFINERKNRMYQLEYHQLDQNITQLLNHFELYNFAIVTDDKNKHKYQTQIHQFVATDLNYLEKSNLCKHSLIHYQYFQFLTEQHSHPIVEFTVGNTAGHITTLQNRLHEIRKLLSVFL